MLMRWRAAFLSLTILLAVCVSDALACSCSEPGPPCQNYFISDVVFVGTVRSISAMPDAHDQATVRVEFQDVAASRGVDGTSVTVFTAEQSMSCGYPFKQGERYVVYANRSKQTTQILASICSRTRHISQAVDDMTFLGTFAKPAASPLVFGTVSHWDRNPATGDERIAGPVAGVVLTLDGPGGSFQTRTDRDGRYQFEGIPAGTYTLTGLPPPLFSAASIKAVFELRDARACRQANFQIRYDSRVSGSIVDADGRPVTNALVELTPVDQIANAGFVPSEMAITDRAGSFELTEVTPDRYMLGVNLRLGGDIELVSPTRFHLDASDPANATSFDVRPGERVTLDPMVMPRPSRAYVVAGRITFPDGKPAAGVEVSLEDGHQRWKRVAAAVETGVDGTFSFVVNEGIAYVANARYENPLVPGRTDATASMPFVASEEKVKKLEMVLSPRR
jgi:hypothetical protein